jgi:hypothetical protein
MQAVYSAAAKPTSSSKAGHAQPTFTTAAAADAQQWLHAATQDLAAAAGAESMLQLCRAVSLEVAAWQQRKPAAEQVLHPSMQLRHQLMLLTLCTLAEGGSMDRVQAALARQPAQQAKDPCPSTLSSPKRSPKRSAANSPGRSPGRSTASSPWCSSGTSNRSTVTSPDHILEALLHHDLVRRDAYASVFLPSMRVNASVGQQHSTDDGGADGGAASRPNSYARGGAAAVHDNTACGGGSMAALLVWVTRNAATAFFLTGVLGIAQREQLLLEQVGGRVGAFQVLPMHVVLQTVTAMLPAHPQPLLLCSRETHARTLYVWPSKAQHM